MLTKTNENTIVGVPSATPPRGATHVARTFKRKLDAGDIDTVKFVRVNKRLDKPIKQGRNDTEKDTKKSIVKGI
jgi:hypothetical protein